MNISKVLERRILEAKFSFLRRLKRLESSSDPICTKNNVYWDAKIEYQKTFFKFNLGNFDLII